MPSWANPTPPRRLQVRARHPHKQSDIATFLEAAKIPPDPSATSSAQEQRHQRQTTRHSGSRRSVAKVRYALVVPADSRWPGRCVNTPGPGRPCFEWIDMRNRNRRRWVEDSIATHRLELVDRHGGRGSSWPVSNHPTEGLPSPCSARPARRERHSPPIPRARFSASRPTGTLSPRSASPSSTRPLRRRGRTSGSPGPMAIRCSTSESTASRLFDSRAEDPAIEASLDLLPLLRPLELPRAA